MELSAGSTKDGHRWPLLRLLLHFFMRNANSEAAAAQGPQEATESW